MNERMSSHPPFICQPGLVFGLCFWESRVFFLVGAQIPPALVRPWTCVHLRTLVSKQILFSPFPLALTFPDLYSSSE